MRHLRSSSLRAPIAGLVLALFVGCSSTKVDTSGGGGTTTRPVDPDKAVVEQHPGDISLGPLPEAPEKADSALAPVKISMINQEDVDLGSYPEVRQGAEAAVAFINAELGGVGGHPIDLTTCKANFTPEKSQKCAQQAVQDEAVAVLGGLDIMSGNAVPVLEAAGVPYIGGIPINLDEMRSPISFQFSGGSPGAFAAFASHMAETLKAKKVTVAYADYAPIKTAALDYGVRVLKDLGVDDVKEVAFPIVATDYAPVVAKAFEDDPDAVVVSATDKACIDVMKQADRYDGQLYLVGACAAPAITKAAGDAAEGVIFNIEGPIRPGEAGNDGKVYNAAMARYAPDAPAPSAATVSFRAMMNLWSVMTEIGPDDLTPAALLAEFKQAREHPSFTGHPFTCDGKQIPALASLCSPQQILAQLKDEKLTQVTDWIDVSAVVGGTAG
ncbi:MAG: ABC transporter substrate-binding protein [Acidimicrobiales bacterium]